MKKKDCIKLYGIEEWERRLKYQRDYWIGIKKDVFRKEEYNTKQRNRCAKKIAAMSKEELKDFRKKESERHKIARKEGKYQEREKQYRKEHRKKRRENDKEYRKEHVEEQREYFMKYRNEHKEHLNDYHKEWRGNNPEKAAIYYNKRRQRGFIPLTEPISEPFDWHHIHPDLPYVIAVPRNIHRSGFNHEEHYEGVNTKWLKWFEKHPEAEIKINQELI